MLKEIPQLHTHTDASKLDGMLTVDKLVNYGALNNVPVAITDHGIMVNYYKFHKKCLEKGVKGIIGLEFYYCDDTQDKSLSHIILYAKNDKGLKNLYELTYRSIKNFYYKPRVTLEDIKACSSDLICSTACISSKIATHIINKQQDKAIENINALKGIFGEDLYFELQPHFIIPNQKEYNEFLINNVDNSKLIIGTDAHYEKQSDADTHDTLLCMSTNKTKDDEKRMRFSGNKFYLLNTEEVIDMFTRENNDVKDVYLINKCIDNMYELCDKVTGYDLSPKNPLLPVMSDHDDKTLELLTMEGAYFRYGKYPPSERINYELSVIKEKGYSAYFIMTYDFLDYCRKNNIPVGVGRGSVAGSVVAYCLGIHELDPIKYNLLFERFLNPTRNSCPDIDSDFCYERRNEVIEYVKNKYGNDNVSTMLANGTLSCSNVVRKVLSAYGYESAVINKVSTRYIPKVLNISLSEAYAQSKELREFLDAEGRENIKRDMFALEGNISHFSKHAAGIIISPEPIYKHCPVIRDEDDKTMLKTQLDKKQVEDTGLVKFDFLGLKLLTIWGTTLKNIERTRGYKATLDKLYGLDMEHVDIYKQLNSGRLTGIFQFNEYAGMKTIEDVKPQSFEDIMACESICRPGVKEAEVYKTNRKSIIDGKKYDKPTYWNFVKHILEPTYGCIIYQEQTMLLFNEIGGFTLGEADSLRKVKSLEPYRERFVTNAILCGLTQLEATELFNRFDLGYSFNRSHAGVYGKTSAICCYLKWNFFAEYMSACMNMELLKTREKSQLDEMLLECKERDIVFVAPDINVATNEFILLDHKTIMLPISFIKGLGENSVRYIIDNRPYASYDDFVNRVPKKSVNKTNLEKLIKCGSFDKLISKRNLYISGHERYFYDEDLRMNYELEVLGMSLGKHPLDNVPNTSIHNYANGEQVCINAIIKDITIKLDKNGNTMAFVKCENKLCTFEAIVFSYAYNNLHSLLLTGNKVFIQGKKDNSKILVSDIKNI